ncbi:hypothetical protein ACLQ26_26310 [Micromonospora sp. DT43]|uniref:hypothetical protein n=1 Tax=Micromonospora sp. DT43 TaxID=3393440 RepID=UPI003CF9F774
MMFEPSTSLSSGPRRGSASALRWVADNLAVVGPDPAGAIVAMARLLPSEPGVVTVVGQIIDPDDWALITEVLPIAVPPGAAARLAVSGTGTAPAHGPPPAATLAHQLQADVHAPSGQLLLVPGGGLFAVDGWRWFRPDGSVSDGGHRYPPPQWEAEVDTLVRHVGAGVRAHSVPAGLWLYADSPDLPAPNLDDLAFAVPMDVDRVTVVLGRPGATPPGVEATLSILDALDPSMVIAPYGGAAAEAMRLATTIADRWDRPVEVAAGLPTLDDEHRPVSIAIDPAGDTWWTPPVARLRYAPGVPPMPLGTVDFLADLRPAGAGAFRLDERWVVEPTQFGLWVRPPFAGQHTGDVRRRPWDAQWFTVVVGLPGLPLPDDVLPILHLLLNRLPEGARARVRFVPEELSHLLASDAADRPDVVLAAQRSTPPRWWHRDARLFAVLLTVDGRTGTVHTDAGEVEPGQLGEIIAPYRDSDPRPVLLVSSVPVAPEIEQQIADQMQVVTIGRRADGWWASLPRRVDRVPRRASRLASSFPFREEDLADVLAPARSTLPRARRDPDADEPLLILARLPEEPARDIRRGADGSVLRTVVAARGPDWRRPFRLAGQPVTAWDFATVVADRRPGWVGGDEVVWVEADHLTEPVLRLLANYLGCPVGARASLVADAPPTAAASGWCTVSPRTDGQHGHSGQDGRGYFTERGSHENGTP